jgi:hypothetical protein
MKDKIELSFDAFKRWEKTLGSKGMHVETRWESLVQEAEKKEPIAKYAAVTEDNHCVVWDTEQAAKDYLIETEVQGRVVKLVEVQE